MWAITTHTHYNRCSNGNHCTNRKPYDVKGNALPCIIYSCPTNTTQCTECTRTLYHTNEGNVTYLIMYTYTVMYTEHAYPLHYAGFLHILVHYRPPGCLVNCFFFFALSCMQDEKPLCTIHSNNIIMLQK